MGGLVGIGLADAIAEIKAELASAQEKLTPGGMRMTIKSVTVELRVVATQSGEASVGFRVPVIGLDMGGGSSMSREQTHTVTVAFDAPLDAQNAPWQVGAQDQDPGM